MAAFFLNDRLRKRVERSPALQWLRWRAEAWILGLFWLICERLGPEGAPRFGRRLFATIGPRMVKSKHIERNLRLAFPELDAAACRRLARQVCAHVGAVLAEYPHIGALRAANQFDLDLRCDIEAYRAGTRRAIFVAPHLGNWELTVLAAVLNDIPVSVVYASGGNPLIDEMLRRRRAALGCRLISSDQGARGLIREINAGRFLGMVIDARDDDGAPLAFFGHPKTTTIAPARLALKFDCDLVVVRAERLADGRYRIEASTPIRPDPMLATEKERAAAMMCDVNRVFERWIRERPEQWVCLKRAFPKDREPKRAIFGGDPTPQASGAKLGASGSAASGNPV